MSFHGKQNSGIAAQDQGQYERAALGEDGFAAAREAGEALTAEQAIAAALPG